MNIMNTSQNLLFAVLPKSVEQLSKQLHSKIIDPIILQKLVELSVSYWKGEEVEQKEWETIAKNSYLPLPMFEELFSGVLNLTLAVSKIPEKVFNKEIACDELMKFGLSDKQAEHIIQIKTLSTPNVPGFLKIHDAKWRIDVTISTSNVSRILEPWILMELCLKSGDKKTLHIPLAQFHSLRFQVASCLNQLSKLPV